ncbi:3-oxoadipate enol-lactone hydrolase [Halorubrum persicum]|uniref:3-oxoadipate enol-lactone hydrolase n=1 Tax=Halorubrum persicum TaxID=1383844 RepID=A0A2G1WJ27_9EURY|nr:3-oxoadipate enol-lactone hydrolase [Halorubrum persicum]
MTRDGVDIHYAVDGPRDGPTVLLLEGLGYGRWMWRWLTEDLADEYEVLRPDNRGTGDSDAPDGPYAISEMAADARAVLDDRDVDRVHVCGASMGGMIAQELALADDRVASLTLLCTSPGGEEAPEMPAEVREHIFSAPDDLGPRERIRYLMEPAVSDGFYEREPDLVDRIVDWRLAGDATPSGREAQAAAVTAFDATDRLDEISVPTLVLHGTDDRVLPVGNAELLAAQLPHASVERVEGGPHLFFIEERDAIDSRIRSFLDEVA